MSQHGGIPTAMKTKKNAWKLGIICILNKRIILIFLSIFHKPLE